MPIYDYQCRRCGKRFERRMSFEEYDRRGKNVRCSCGGKAERIIIGVKTPPPSCWPKVSWAMAVHPSQIKEAIAADKKLGVEAEYRPDGSVVFRDRKHRARFLKAHGFYDRDAGYDDPSPG